MSEEEKKNEEIRKMNETIVQGSAESQSILETITANQQEQLSEILQVVSEATGAQLGDLREIMSEFFSTFVNGQLEPLQESLQKFARVATRPTVAMIDDLVNDANLTRALTNNLRFEIPPPQLSEMTQLGMTALYNIERKVDALEPQIRNDPTPPQDEKENIVHQMEELRMTIASLQREIAEVKDGTRLVNVNMREVLSAVESEAQRKEIGGTVTNIYIGGNVESSNIVSGNNNVITQRIQNSFNKAEAADIQVELKNTLKQLADAVVVMAKSLPDEQATEVADDLSKLVEEATKSKPNKKWYSVSIEGLIKAAENLDKLGTPVISLSRKVLSLLTGGVVKS
jgi:hypothetical protein